MVNYSYMIDYSNYCDNNCGKCYKKWICDPEKDALKFGYQYQPYDIDIYEKHLNHEYIDDSIIIDVPGYSKEDVEINASKNIITIKLKKQNGDLSYAIQYDNDKYVVESAKCKNGQLIIELIKNKAYERSIKVS